MAWSIRKPYRPLTSRRRTPNRRSTPRPLLCVEGLEERTVPTVSFQPQFGIEHAHDGGGSKMGNATPGVPIHLIFWGSYWATSAGAAQAGQIENVLNTT